MSRSWFDRFWSYEDINPGLGILLDRFDEVQQEFIENKDKLMWRSWGYQAGYFGQRKIAYDGWEVAGIYGEHNSMLEAPKWDDDKDMFEQQDQTRKGRSIYHDKVDPATCSYYVGHEHKKGGKNQWVNPPKECHLLHNPTDDEGNVEWKVGSETGVNWWGTEEDRPYVHSLGDKGIMACDNVQHLPLLSQLLYDSGVRRRVGISVTYPGRGIAWHADNDPERKDEMVIRGLIGLDIRVEPGEECYLGLGTPKNEEKRDIRNKECFFFYSRVPHHVINELKYPRYCIIMDHAVHKDTLRNK